MNRLLIFVALLLGGCASFPNYDAHPEQDKSISVARLKESNKGAILISVTTSLAPGGEVVSPTLYYDKTGEEDAMIHSQLSPYGVMMVPFGRTRHFENANGKLLVERLEPGRYSLLTWGINNGSGLHIWPRFKLDPLVFEVKAGEIAYLGNAHFLLDTGKNVFGMNITGGGWVTLRDERERDLAVAAKMLPNVKPEEVVVEVVDGMPWTLEFVNAKINTIVSE